MTAARDLPDDTARLALFARDVLRRIHGAGMTIATAESCTGGLLGSLFTDIEGLGSTYERGFITYSEEAKVEMLGIEPSVIARHGVVSREVVIAMVEGALDNSRADLAVAITGFAGRAGKTDEPGLVRLAVKRRGGSCRTRQAHYGDVGRDRVRMLTAHAALEMIDDLVGTLA